jgi:hypothetical protein
MMLSRPAKPILAQIVAACAGRTRRRQRAERWPDVIGMATARHDVGPEADAPLRHFTRIAVLFVTRRPEAYLSH